MQYGTVSGESTQTPNYELVIYKPSVYCLVNGDKLISGSETISIMWTYPTEENLQTVFPFNNCTVQILRQETDKVVSFKAFMKLCSGNYVFWPEIGVKSRQKWDITSNDRKYFKQEWRKIVSTPGELRGATSVAAHFDKVALRKDNMSLKEFTFRVYQRQADWEVVGVTLKIDLLPVFWLFRYHSYLVHSIKYMCKLTSFYDISAVIVSPLPGGEILFLYFLSVCPSVIKSYERFSSEISDGLETL